MVWITSESVVIQLHLQRLIASLYRLHYNVHTAARWFSIRISNSAKTLVDENLEFVRNFLGDFAHFTLIKQYGFHVGPEQFELYSPSQFS